MKSLVGVVALVGVGLIAAAPAWAEIESALVRKGVAAYAELDYQKAITLLEQARNESLTREEKILTYRTLGMAYVALGQNGPAKIDFQRLLRVEPTATLDRSVAPKVRAVFEEAKAEAATSVHGVAPALAAVMPTVTPAAPREGRSVVVRASHPGGVAKKMV